MLPIHKLCMNIIKTKYKWDGDYKVRVKGDGMMGVWEGHKKNDVIYEQPLIGNASLEWSYCSCKDIPALVVYSV